MPTEADFLAAATMFDDAGLRVAAVPGQVGGAFGADVSIGGQLTLEIEALVQGTAAECHSASSALEALAGTCRERAAIVAAYAEALGIYGSRLQSYEWGISRWERNRSDHLSDPTSFGAPGPRPVPPRRPIKPAEWVEL